MTNNPQKGELWVRLSDGTEVIIMTEKAIDGYIMARVPRRAPFAVQMSYFKAHYRALN